MRGTPGKLRLALFYVVLLLWGFASADRQSFGAWSFVLDGEVKASVENGIRAFSVKEATYLFTPPEPLAGRTLEAIATTTIADLTRGQTSSVKLVRRQTVDNGVLLAYSGLVVNSVAATGSRQTYFFFEKQGQWGLALLMAGAGTDQVEALEPLSTVSFNPSSLMVKAEVLPRLPAVPWSTPRADRVATTTAGVDYPTARRRGLAPQEDLLPDSFDCYFSGDDGGRAMTPTPDLRIGVRVDGTYAFTDGVTRAEGRWTQTRPAGSRHPLTLTGPLVAQNTWVQGADDNGQSFSAFHTGTQRKVACYQAGARAEAVRLEMTRKRIGGEPLTCRDARGGQPYPLTFGASTYSTPRGNGRARSVFSGTSQGLVDFSGGSLDLSVGEMNEDEDGNRELRISEKTTRGSFFYHESTTTLIATCRAKGTAKPTALYGPAAAPKTAFQGGPSGLFVSNQLVVSFIGEFAIPVNRHEVRLSLFRPDGYVLNNIDPSELGAVPDCGRTKPNGDPFCDRYEIKGGGLRTQDEDGWSNLKPFKILGNGFRIGDTGYFPVIPLTGQTLVGVYSTDADTADSRSLGMGSLSLYNALSSGYLFTADGRFQWKYDSSSSSVISPSLITGGGLSSASSSDRQDGGQGSYILKENWLTLTFSDGRRQRLFVYAQPGEILKQDPSLGDRVNIGGTWLTRRPFKP